VRAGPFASREAATRAVDKLKSLGLKPGNVAAPAARNG
jgi:cell division septation protein DedD